MRSPEDIADEIVSNFPSDLFRKDFATTTVVEVIAAAIQHERERAIKALYLAGCYTRDVALAVLDSADEVE